MNIDEIKEEWKDIKGYEGLYQISNLGRVKSLERIIKYKDGRKYKVKEKIKENNKIKHGYCIVSLYKNCHRKSYRINRLVAEAFIPNPNNYPIVNHKDENPSNNNYKNLEWCTQKYNCNYGTSNERVSKKLSKKVYQYDLNKNYIREFESATYAERNYGIKRTGISDCCNGRTKTYKGFIYSFNRW